jgi:hypothetical protein
MNLGNAPAEATKIAVAAGARIKRVTALRLGDEGCTMVAVGFTHVLAAELAPMGVNVASPPGLTRTRRDPASRFS